MNAPYGPEVIEDRITNLSGKGRVSFPVTLVIPATVARVPVCTR
jgi:hypothetical protein